MKRFICKKTCYWGPQPGAESMYVKGDEIMASGSEPQIGEFFDEVIETPAPKKGGKKISADDDI